MKFHLPVEVFFILFYPMFYGTQCVAPAHAITQSMVDGQVVCLFYCQSLVTSWCGVIKTRKIC